MNVPCRLTFLWSRRAVRAIRVRFGSKADICNAKSHVCFTPNSDRESGLRQTVMSALPPKADMCSALVHVRFGPIADSCSAANDRYSITSSANICIEIGTTIPSALAAFMLTTNSNLADRMTGRSAGISPLRIRPARMPACRYASPSAGP